MAQPTHAARISDGGTEEILYDYAPGLLPTGAWRGDGMWRYRKLLPLDERPISYPLPVGGTPLIAAPSLRELVSLPNLWLKDETRGPTGSNKDRATALVLQKAMASGMQRVTCASTGNVAVSLAIRRCRGRQRGDHVRRGRRGRFQAPVDAPGWGDRGEGS